MKVFEFLTFFLFFPGGYGEVETVSSKDEAIATTTQQLLSLKAGSNGESFMDETCRWFLNYAPVNASTVEEVHHEAAFTLEKFRSSSKSVGVLVIGGNSSDLNLILQHLQQFFGVEEEMETVMIDKSSDFHTMIPQFPFPEKEGITSLYSLMSSSQIIFEGVDKINICLIPTVNYASVEAEFIVKTFITQMLRIVEGLKVFVMVDWGTLNSPGEGFDVIMDSVLETFAIPEKLHKLGMIITGVPRNSRMRESFQLEEVKEEIVTYLYNYIIKMELKDDKKSLQKSKLILKIMGEAFKKQHDNYEYEFYDDEQDKKEQLHLAILWEPGSCGKVRVGDHRYSDIVYMLEKEERVGLNISNQYWFERNQFKTELEQIIANFRNREKLANVFPFNETDKMRKEAGQNIAMLSSYYQHIMKNRFKATRNMSEVEYEYGKILDFVRSQEHKGSIVKVLEGVNEILNLDHDLHMWESLVETFSDLSVIAFMEIVSGMQREEGSQDGNMMNGEASMWGIVDNIKEHYEIVLESEPEVQCGDELYNSKDYNVAVVYGNVVKFSDFIIGERYGVEEDTLFLCEEKGRRLDGLIVLAKEKVYVDRDVQRPGFSLGVVADEWKVLGRRMINLDGKDGEAHIIQRADSATVKGGHGMDGAPGNPGGNGGIFIGLGRKFEEDSPRNFITIRANAGNGGRGQDGGRGKSGKVGRNASIDDFPPPATFKGLVSPKEFRSNFSWTMRSYNEPSYVTLAGGKGGGGGNAGKGGIGGEPGRPGKVYIGKYELETKQVPENDSEVVSPHNITIMKVTQVYPDNDGKYDSFASGTAQHGIMGKDGKPGRPGSGGKNGYGFKCSIKDENTDPKWRKCAQVSRNGKGKRGSVPKIVNFEGARGPLPQANFTGLLQLGFEKFEVFYGGNVTLEFENEIVV